MEPIVDTPIEDGSPLPPKWRDSAAWRMSTWGSIGGSAASRTPDAVPETPPRFDSVATATHASSPSAEAPRGAVKVALAGTKAKENQLPLEVGRGASVRLLLLLFSATALVATHGILLADSEGTGWWRSANLVGADYPAAVAGLATLPNATTADDNLWLHARLPYGCGLPKSVTGPADPASSVTLTSNATVGSADTCEVYVGYGLSGNPNALVAASNFHLDTLDLSRITREDKGVGAIRAAFWLEFLRLVVILPLLLLAFVAIYVTAGDTTATLAWAMHCSVAVPVLLFLDAVVAVVVVALVGATAHQTAHKTATLGWACILAIIMIPIAAALGAANISRAAMYISLLNRARGLPLPSPLPPTVNRAALLNESVMTARRGLVRHMFAASLYVAVVVVTAVSPRWATLPAGIGAEGHGAAPTMRWGVLVGASWGYKAPAAPTPTSAFLLHLEPPVSRAEGAATTVIREAAPAAGNGSRSLRSAVVALNVVALVCAVVGLSVAAVCHWSSYFVLLMSALGAGLAWAAFGAVYSRNPVPGATMTWPIWVQLATGIIWGIVFVWHAARAVSRLVRARCCRLRI